MNSSSPEDLRKEIEDLRARLAVAEEALGSSEALDSGLSLVDSPSSTHPDRLTRLAIRSEHLLRLERDVDRILVQVFNIEDVLSRIVERIGRTLRSSFCSIWLMDPNEYRLTCRRYWLSSDQEGLQAFARAKDDVYFKRGEGLPGRVWQTGLPAWIECLAEDSNFVRADLAKQAGLLSGAAVPLMDHGVCVGALEWFYSEACKPHRGLVESMSAIGSDLGHYIVRQGAKVELKDRHELVTEITSLLPGVLYVFDIAARRNLFVNRQTAELLGYDEREIRLMGPDFLPSVLHPDDRLALENYFAGLLHLGPDEVADMEYRLMHRDGTYRWFHSRDVPYRRLPNGQVSQILGIATDISREKKVEQNLRDRDLLLRLAMNASLTIVFEWDIVHDEVRRFHSTEEMLPANEDAFGRFEDVVKVIHPNDQLLFRADIRAALESTDGVYSSKYRIVGPNGEIRWLSEVGRVQFDSDRRPLRLIGISRNITDQKQFEESLKSSIQRAELAQMAARAALYESDAAGVKVRFDPAVYRLIGISPDSINSLAEGWRTLVHPDDLSRYDAAVQNRLAQRDEWSIEYRVRRVDGEEVWVADRARLIAGESSGPNRVVGMIIDITREKLASSESREMANRLAIATEAAALGIHDYHIPTGVVRWDRRVRDIFGVDEDESITLGLFYQCVHPDDRSRVDEAVQSALNSKESGVYAAEYRVIHQKTGVIRWVDASGRTFFDQGQAIRLIGTVRDITTEKTAAQTLWESEFRFKRACDAARTLVYEAEIGAESRVVVYGLENITGTDMPTGSIESWWNDRVHEDDRSSHQQEVSDCLANPACSTALWRYRVRHADGSWRHVYDNVRILRDDQGKAVRMVGTVLDVTERVEAEHALREADRRKDEFLAMLAHELRNPMAPIRNAAHLLAFSGANDPTVEQARAIIDRQVTHLARLVDDLLDVSRVSRGKINLKKETVSISSVLDQAVETSRSILEKNGHELFVERPAEPALVEGDFTRLSQIVSNLLNNAARYTDRGGKVTLSARSTDDEVTIHVKDTGSGMSPEVLARVFDLFFQADRPASSTEGGLGIGLSLAKSLVDMHGGTISAQSEGIGKGSEFIVRLPRSREKRTGAPKETGDSAAQSTRPKSILVIDDNKDSAESMAMLLRALGHEVVMAHDGEAGIAHAMERKLDAILCDIGLPGMSGLDVCRKLREQGLRETIFIAMTGFGQEEDRLRSKRAGFDAHLAKPVDIEAVCKLLAARP